MPRRLFLVLVTLLAGCPEPITDLFFQWTFVDAGGDHVALTECGDLTVSVIQGNTVVSAPCADGGLEIRSAPATSSWLVALDGTDQQHSVQADQGVVRPDTVEFTIGLLTPTVPTPTPTPTPEPTLEPTPEACDDGKDNDGDDLEDCDDPDCAADLACPSCDPAIVIARVYTTGGSGGGFDRDFVEVLNRSGAAVDLSAYELLVSDLQTQAWLRSPLSGTAPPNGFFLISLATFAQGGVVAADAGGPNVDIEASNVAIALVEAGATAQPFSCPNTWVDLVGLGGSPWCAEAQAWYLGGPSGKQAIDREDGGCADTDDNAADFSMEDANAPRTSADSHPCTCD